ncbi:MAG: hypothetical protein EOO39_06995 [Cytophagaceae bacterium]|nr:MAG: hypothetical protein EOO39_06995 [Cytophagaceae bacterium]
MTEPDRLLKHLLSVYFDRPDVDLGEVFSANLSDFLSLSALFDNEAYFLKSVETDSSAFMVQRFPDFVFSTDESDRVFVRKGKKKIPFSGSLTALLITEFALWLYQLKEAQGLAIKSNFKKYPVVRQLGTLLFKEDDYPNKLWSGTANQFIVVVLGLEQELYIFVNNEDSLPAVSQSFGEKADVAKRQVHYQTELLDNAFIRDNRLYGQLYNTQLAITIPVEINADTTNVLSTDDYVKRYRDFILALTDRDYRDIVMAVSKELTDAAHSQGDYVPTPIDYETLGKELHLVAVKFDADDETIVAEFNAPAIFLKDKIHVQLNFDTKIEDITIQAV